MIASRRPAPGIPTLIVLSILLAGGWYLVIGDVGLNLWDEGYLWHNVRRTFEGAVPIRDFRSYDPGRYYWGALWAAWLGPGLVSLRLSLAAFQGLGLLAALLTLRRAVTTLPGLLAAGSLATIWMFPRDKLVELGLVMLAVWLAARLVERPTRLRHLTAGLLVGLTAFFARNFCLYFGLGFAGVMLHCWDGVPWRQRGERLLAGLSGILLGLLPLLTLCVASPGFLGAYLASVTRLAGRYSMVEPLPIPWPWRCWTPGLIPLGWAYVAQYAWYAAVLLAYFRDRRRFPPVLLASCLIGLPVLHHGAVRADFAHFAVCFYPVLAGMLALLPKAGEMPWSRSSRLALLGASAASAFLALTLSGQAALVLEKARLLTGKPTTLTAHLVGGERVWLERGDSLYLSGLERCMALTTAPDDLFVAPFEAGLYPLFGKRAPVWDAFPIHRAPESEQREDIDRIDRSVVWALVSDAPLDGRPELRYSVTHSLVWEHLLRTLEPVECPVLRPGQLLLRRARPG